ncbi:TadE/TadG family type IV pilus assembly protein [Aestuariibius sp. 2305UL40-4]|uniref:TadE/TadG family type IV pilus assembly protein n=1 Tax=Aestuariibius violaceus TaxID=3234132 RepID=UPI00345EF411
MKYDISKFRDNEDGGVSVEVAILFPILAWAFLVCFIWFDSFRLKTIDRQAAETIADIISRENVAISPEFLTGMHDLLRLLTRTTAEPQLVVSSFSFDGTDYVLEWSEARGSGASRLTEADIPLIEEELPILDDTNTVIVVQTATDYRPIIQFDILGFSQTITDFELTQFIRVNPRRATEICYDECTTNNDGTDGDGTDNI